MSTSEQGKGGTDWEGAGDGDDVGEETEATVGDVVGECKDGDEGASEGIEVALTDGNKGGSVGVVNGDGEGSLLGEAGGEVGGEVVGELEGKNEGETKEWVGLIDDVVVVGVDGVSEGEIEELVGKLSGDDDGEMMEGAWGAGEFWGGSLVGEVDGVTCKCGKGVGESVKDVILDVGCRVSEFWGRSAVGVVEGGMKG